LHDLAKQPVCHLQGGLLIIKPLHHREQVWLEDWIMDIQKGWNLGVTSGFKWNLGSMEGCMKYFVINKIIFSSLIKCICSCTYIQYPCDVTHDNYPIYAEIHQCIQQLKPLDLRFFHIKGHQDQQCNKPLTLPERLNIECDARAAKLPPYDNLDKLHSNP